MPTLQSLLVPIDGSPASLRALDHALALAEDYDAELEVLQVVTTGDLRSNATDDDAAQAIDEAVERAQAARPGRIARRIVHGDPVGEIVKAAHHADLIVMGTHGYVGRLHELAGSTAEGVVRNAPCPVMTVRDATGGYQSFAERRHHRPSVAERDAR